MPGARPSSPPPSWVAHPNPGPLLLSPPSLPRRCPCPQCHLSTPGSPPPLHPHTRTVALGVCAHLRRGTKEVNPDRSPLLICVLGTPQGSDGGGMGLSAILLSAPCPPPAPMEIQAPWGPPTESLTALHRAGKAQDSHLVHIFLVCSEMTPHCWGEKGRVSRWRSSHMAPRLRSTMGSPVPVTPQPPSAVLSPPDRAATTFPQDWDFLPSGVQGFSRGRCTSLSLGSDHKCPCSQPGSQPCWDRAEPGETPRVPVPLHPVQLEIGLLLHPSEPPKPHGDRPRAPSHAPW